MLGSKHLKRIVRTIDVLESKEFIKLGNEAGGGDDTQNCPEL